MTTRLIVAVVCASLVWLTSCGGAAFLVGTSPGFSGVVVATGTCTSVQIVNTVGPGGGFILVTVVTLFGSGFSSSLNFCGDVSGRFPLNRSLTVNYTNGSGCATPVSILIV
jgi:hypothetical protein